MSIFECAVCGHVFDEEKEGMKWADLPDGWCCPVCDSGPVYFTCTETDSSEESNEAATESTTSSVDSERTDSAAPESKTATRDSYLRDWQRVADDTEEYLADIHSMATTGSSVIEPMRTQKPVFSWHDILIKGAQLAKLPLNRDQDVDTHTVIGPKSDHPLILETPVFVTHMSFGALSREAKIALARGSAAAGTAMCSGEGGILPESIESAHKYIFEYVPNKYSVTEENLKRVDAIEIKIGQSTKPGMGGHLPAGKVTPEVAAIRGFPEGSDIISPAHFDDIRTQEELTAKVTWLRDVSGGKPIGIKLAAGNIEQDMAIAVAAGPDFITIDGRAGATGATPKFVKDSCSIPTIFALYRARRYLDENGIDGISLIITGQLRVSPDFIKALALGADAIAIGTAALVAIGCQQYRICNTGKCPVGITTQDPELRKRFDIELSAQRLANYFAVTTKELQDFARMTGNDDVHALRITDLCTTNSEISDHTAIEHV